MVFVNPAAIIAAQQGRLVRQFRDAGAIGAANAISADAVPGSTSDLFDQLVQTGVLVATADGKYFLDERAAQRFNQRRGTQAMLAFLFLLILLAVLLLVMKL